MISLIPYRKVTLTTHLTVEEVEDRVDSNIADFRLHKIFGPFGRLPKEPFVGIIANDTFHLSQIVSRVWGGRLSPVIRGQIIGDLNRTKITVTALLHLFDFVASGLLFMLSLMVLVVFSFNPVSPLVFLGIWGLCYVLMMIHFNIRSSATIQRLKDLLEATDE